MFSISRFAIKRPVCILICVISLILFGTTSVMNMDMALMAEMNMPVLLVFTTYTGASPDDIDQNVTDVIEDSLSSVSEVKTIQSSSSEGMSMVMMQFDYSVDIDDKYQDVSNALAVAKYSLPSDCGTPTVLEINMNSMMPIMTVAVESNGRADIRGYVEDTIVPMFERIGGVSDVTVIGGSEQYIQVLLDEEKLGQYNQTLSSVAAAISSAEYEMTLGELGRGNVDVDIIGSQKYDIYQDIADTAITLSSGDIIHVYDVASVSKQNKEVDSYSRRDGHDVVRLSISKDQSANTVSICRQASALIQQLNGQNLGLTFTEMSNSGEDIMENIMSVAEALVEGVLISAVVLFLFLGEWKASLIVALSMPLSVLATLILMSFTGMSLNIISLGGLVLGIGMLVDNSIVVLDSCFQESRNNGNMEEAVIRGTDIVVGSVIASTATTVVVFLPIGMMNGMAGQLFKDICFTIVYSLCASMVSAVTLVPLLFVKLKPRERRNNFFGRLVQWLERGYARLLSFLLGKKLLVIVVAAAMLVGSVKLFGQLDMDLMGGMETNSISIDVSFKKGLKLEEMDKIVRQLEELVAKQPETESYSATVGSGSGMSALMSSSDASVSVTILDSEKKNVDQIVQRLRNETAGFKNCDISIDSSSMMSTFSGGSDVEIDLVGTDYDTLKAFSPTLEAMMRTMPEFHSVSSSVSDGTPRAKIKVDSILAGSVGMSPATVLSNVRTKLSGSTATTFTEGDTEYDVIVEYPPERYETMADLMGMLIDSPTGEKVPLTSLATIEYSMSPSAIAREDGSYVITISGTPNIGESTNRLSQKAMEQARQLQLPNGVSFKVGGSMDTMNEEFASILNAMATAVFLVFAVMAIQFESLKFPLVVMMSIPFAFTGSFLALYLTNSTINMGTMLGMIMLVGIVVNNAIVLIDYTNLLRREQGMPVRQALVESGRSRLRPILMSSMTTIFSDIPLAVGTGVDTMSGMAIVVIGGLSLSTLVTLFVVPTFYLLADSEERREKRQRKKEQKAAKRQAKLEARMQKTAKPNPVQAEPQSARETYYAQAEKPAEQPSKPEETAPVVEPETVTVGAAPEPTAPAPAPEEPKPAEPAKVESVEAEILTETEARKTYYMAAPKKSKPKKTPPRHTDHDSYRRGK